MSHPAPQAQPSSATATIDWQTVRRQFMLGPGEIYLNGGTFSALPRPVYEARMRLMLEAEANPTRGGTAQIRAAMWDTHAQVARYVGAQPADFVLHSNVTQALSQAIFGHPWPGGGELLLSDQEYGAIRNAWREVARRHGMTLRTFNLPADPQNEQQLFDAVMDAVTPAAAGVLLSHIPSATGLVLPVERIARELRERGVPFFVDGAHAPGLLPLNLGETDIDYYGGNLHKWFMGPKGTAFLHVRRDRQRAMMPYIVGFGGAWADEQATELHYTGPSRFASIFGHQGLRDATAMLALPAALRFRESIGEAAISARLDELAEHGRAALSAVPGLTCRSPQERSLYRAMVRFHMPGHVQPRTLHETLHERYGITAAMYRDFEGGNALRVSAGIWNEPADLDRLAAALRELLGSAT